MINPLDDFKDFTINFIMLNFVQKPTDVRSMVFSTIGECRMKCLQLRQLI